VTGCQLLFPQALKTHQTVQVLLPGETRPLVCSGRVVWARLERPAPGAPIRCRAGVRFVQANEAAIETFAAKRGATL
jgi:hypothetical protein